MKSQRTSADQTDVHKRNVRFISTRQQREDQTQRKYTFEEATLAGWADDKGMLLPENIPIIDEEMMNKMSSMNYIELCQEILSLFVGEMPRDDLNSLVVNAWECFGNPNIVDLVDIRPKEGGTEVHVCELWAGPTLAFKDLGMTILAQFLNYFLKRKGEKLQLLVGTSGDTGSSAIEAVGSLENLRIVCLYPKGRCSHVQELQMTVANEKYPNSTLYQVEGTSDDLDKPIEAIFEDAVFKKELRVGSVNSVNIVRVLVQTVHYFYAHFKLKREGKPNASFVVPTGAGGHVTAGILAQQMGLPMASLHIATNANDFFHRFLVSDAKAQVQGIVNTTSPSMDIQVPYNLERMLWLASDGDGERVHQWMTDLRQGEIQLPASIHQQLRTRFKLQSSRSSNEQVSKCTAEVFRNSNYVLDPHTAVGVHATTLEQSDEKQIFVCMGCAHPAKFSDSICESLKISKAKFESDVLPNKSNPHVQAALLLSGKEPSGFRVMSKADGESWEKQLRTCLEDAKEWLNSSK